MEANLIGLLDGAFVAAVISLVQVIKSMFPSIAESAKMKRIVTIAVGVLGAVLIAFGYDMGVIETAGMAVKLILETVGTYALIVKPILDRFKK
jgi:hypothetical protein